MTQLKKLTFEELKIEFEKLVKSIERFVPIETKERVNRQGVQPEQESLKKQKIIEKVLVIEESDTESVIVKEEEIEKPVKKRGKIKKQKDKVTSASSEYEIGIDDIPTATKSPIISTLGDLKTMFDPPLSNDAIWGLPLQQKMINWRYYPFCAVHCLTLEASTIYMLADRKYPLSKDASSWLKIMMGFSVAASMVWVSGICNGVEKDCLTVGLATTQQMVISSPCLTDIKVGYSRGNGYWDPTIMIRNKARLVAQGYTREEGIDYDEVFTPIARIEAIRLFLAYASFKDFVVYQMDVKSAFLYEKIKEEVYVCQPPGFEDPDFPDRVYKTMDFKEGKLIRPYSSKGTKVIFCWSKFMWMISSLVQQRRSYAFEKLMHEKFLMSSLGELTFFLGLQVKQKKDGIFISQDKYVAKILKKFRFTEIKTASTPMETQKPLLKDKDGEEVDVHVYRYQVNPKVSHLHVVKRIFRYLKGVPTDSQTVHITIQPSTSKPSEEQSQAGCRKTTNTVPHPSDSTADVPNEESVPTHSNDPLLSGEDRLKLTDLMDICVQGRVEYSADESLDAHEDAFNQGRSIEDIDKDAEVSLVDETQGRSDDAEMFNTDALTCLDEELARRLDAEEQEAARLERENEQEQGELTIEEKLKLFMELIKERKRHFAKLRAEEKRRKPLTKEDDKETNEHEEAEKDDEAEMKKHMEIVQDDEEIAIDSIPLATKPLMIVEYKIVKEGQKRFYHLIRADGSSNSYYCQIYLVLLVKNAKDLRK
ncbi:putative ribonuclease H-like domain-containing protein [Tanacetum coccineum]